MISRQTSAIRLVWVFCSIAAAIILDGLAFGASTADRIPALLDVPSTLARLRPELASRRAELLQRRDTLHSRFQAHNAQCSSVVAGSSQDHACLTSRGILAEALRRHVLKSRAFNAELESSKQREIAVLCSSLDDEMREMSTIDIKIVGLQMEALGKLLHVELGIWESADEPPEDILREATEHLKKMTAVSEQIDELGGKLAWTDEQRTWVLQHIYVATRSSHYDVGSSDTTARGQTDFSSLEKMPAFAGCSRDSEGKLYVPQY